MDPNPFSPGSVDPVPAQTAIGRLYSPGQVAGAAFLGTPLAACWLLGSNFGELGEPSAKRTALLGGLFATIAVVGLAFVLPDNFPSSVLPISYTLGFRQAAVSLQGARFDKHVAGGGVQHSNWRVVGVGIVAMVFVVVVMAAVILMLPEGTLPTE